MHRALIALLLASAAFAATVPLSLDTQGRPLVEVHLRAKDGHERDFLFLLDTGCEVTLVDKSVPAAYLDQDATRHMRFRDAGGKDISSQVGEADLEIAGIRKRVLATQIEMAETRRWQDRPIDGVLGMDFLAGTRFILDAQARKATWDPTQDLQGTTIPLAFLGNKSPQVALQVGPQTVLAKIDTGCAEAFHLPGAFRLGTGSLKVETLGGFGSRARASQGVLASVASGPATWWNVLATFGPGATLVGNPVLLSGPAEFDLAGGRLILSSLAVHPHPAEIPIAWDRSGQRPVLRVFAVGSGTILSRAGARVGDVVVQVADLKGPTLTREALLTLLERNPEPKFVFARRAN